MPAPAALKGSRYLSATSANPPIGRLDARRRGFGQLGAGNRIEDEARDGDRRQMDFDNP